LLIRVFMTAQSTFSRRVFQAGTRIFSQGDPGHVMYYVERGRVQIWQGEAESRRILGYIEPGGIFGEMALIDQKPRMAHASAMVDTALLVIPEPVLREKMKGIDPFVAGLMRMLVASQRRLTQELEALKAQRGGPATAAVAQREAGVGAAEISGAGDTKAAQGQGEPSGAAPDVADKDDW
jgi:CRP/FNR family transcriptional regulator, cyclic AMP receptor protein